MPALTLDHLRQRRDQILALAGRHGACNVRVFGSVVPDPSAEASQRFFATVQNWMHWAAHGHTAAEVVSERADAGKAFPGLTHVRPDGVIRKADVGIAKNSKSGRPSRTARPSRWTSPSTRQWRA